MNRFSILLGSFLFGFMGVFGKKLFALGYAVGDILVLRFFLASLVLTLLTFLFQNDLLYLKRAQIFLSLALGFFGYAVFATLYFTSIKGVSVALAAMLLYTYPFWVTLFSGLLKIEKISARDWILLLFSCLGLVGIFWGQLEVKNLIALFAGLASALSYSIYILVSARYQKNTNPLSSTIYVCWGAFFGLLILHRPDFSSLQNIFENSFLLISGFTLVCTVVPIMLVLHGLQNIKNSEAVMLTMLEPLTAVFMSLVIFKEDITLRQFVGISVVILCLILKTLFGLQKKTALADAVI